jgi:hypothetical protein
MTLFLDNQDIEHFLIIVSWAAFISDLLLSYLIIKLNFNIVKNKFWTFQNDYNLKWCFIVKFILVFAIATGGGASRGKEIVLSITYIGLVLLLAIDFWWCKNIYKKTS